MKNDKIIHVAKIILTTQFFFNGVIETVEINIGEKLAGQISYRNTNYSWLAGWLCKLDAIEWETRIFSISHNVSLHAIFFLMSPIKIC